MISWPRLLSSERNNVFPFPGVVISNSLGADSVELPKIGQISEDRLPLAVDNSGEKNDFIPRLDCDFRHSFHEHTSHTYPPPAGRHGPDVPHRIPAFRAGKSVPYSPQIFGELAEIGRFLKLAWGEVAPYRMRLLQRGDMA